MPAVVQVTALVGAGHRHGARPWHSVSSSRAVPPPPPSTAPLAAAGGGAAVELGGEGAQRRPLLDAELWRASACGHGWDGYVLGGGLEAGPRRGLAAQIPHVNAAIVAANRCSRRHCCRHHQNGGLVGVTPAAAWTLAAERVAATAANGAARRPCGTGDAADARPGGGSTGASGTVTCSKPVGVAVAREVRMLAARDLGFCRGTSPTSRWSTGWWRRLRWLPARVALPAALGLAASVRRYRSQSTGTCGGSSGAGGGSSGRQEPRRRQALLVQMGGWATGLLANGHRGKDIPYGCTAVPSGSGGEAGGDEGAGVRAGTAAGVAGSCTSACFMGPACVAVYCALAVPTVWLIGATRGLQPNGIQQSCALHLQCGSAVVV